MNGSDSLDLTSNVRKNCVSVGGVMASMVAFQAVDPGSTPGRRKIHCILGF